MTEDSIYLEEVDDLIEKSSISKYPCIVIGGIETESEFVFSIIERLKRMKKIYACQCILSVKVPWLKSGNSH